MHFQDSLIITAFLGLLVGITITFSILISSSTTVRRDTVVMVVNKE